MLRVSPFEVVWKFQVLKIQMYINLKKVIQIKNGQTTKFQGF
jgi:hypothetical protein